MSVEQTKVIDFVSVNAENKVALTISDHLEWDEENKHLLLLQEKINSYLGYIESGEIFKSYPDAKDRRIVISIKVMHEPNAEAFKFFAAVKEVVAKIGIDFQYEHTPMEED